MKKFAFRLQRVLDLREAHEKAKLAEFGREQRRLAEERSKLNLFRQEEEAQLGEQRQSRNKPFTVWGQTAGTQYLARIGKVIDFQEGRVEQQERQVDGARTVYLDARRDTRVLEKLKETKTDEWKADMLRDEAKTLDEVGSRKRSDG